MGVNTLLNKRQRTRNLRYQSNELNTPVKLFRKEEMDDGGFSGVRYLLHLISQNLALVYKPSMKDIESLGSRMSETSLTVILPQSNEITVDTSLILRIDDKRLGVGYFDVDEIIPDIQNGRYLKLLVKRHTQAKGQFTEAKDGEN